MKLFVVIPKACARHFSVSIFRLNKKIVFFHFLNWMMCNLCCCFCIYIFPGIQNLTLISDERLYLCDSGDEIRSLNDRCNLKEDCNDKSDERECVQCKYQCK